MSRIHLESNSGPSDMIFVDLDGTLIQTDLLVESTMQLLKKNLLYLFLLPIWLFKGKAFLKQEIANRVRLSVTTLPYHTEFLSYLTEEFDGNSTLILATASNEKFARQVADHVGFFAAVIASDGKINMAGPEKLAAILKMADGHPFRYAGNARVDLAIWQEAQSCIVVNAAAGVERAVRKEFRIGPVFRGAGGRLSLWRKAIRMHQWLKNILVFMPLLAAHQFSNAFLLGQALLGFVAFSLCASSVYLLNDLFDLPSDRNHPTKRYRPFAAGTLQPLHGLFLAPLLLLAGFGLTFFLPLHFFLILLVYYLLTWTYSLYLKQLAIVDVMTLTCLYVIRVVAGSGATGTPLSFWLLAFSLFIFFSLALVKRASELKTLKELHRGDVAGRGYFVSDLEYLHSMGVASGYISALIIALYINSDKVIGLYKTPELLWLTFPLVLYWISRIWLKTGRGEVPDDPLLFAFKDLQSLLVGGAFGLVILAATFVEL